MTRASEFCYIAEQPGGEVLVGMMQDGQVFFARGRQAQEQALRITDAGRHRIAQGVPWTVAPNGIGFRKVLAG